MIQRNRPSPRRFLAVAALALFLGAGVASAAPLPFAAVTGVPDFRGFQFDAGASTLRSADVANPLLGIDPVFGEAVPVTFTQLLPSLGGVPALMKMPAVSLVSTGADSVVFGPGAIAFAMLTPGGAVPWLVIDFSSVTLQYATPMALFSFDVTHYQGQSFDMSGLGDGGAFALGLTNLQVLGAAGAATGLTFDLSEGIVAANSVPEPATLLLFGTGAAALFVRRRNGR